MIADARGSVCVCVREGGGEGWKAGGRKELLHARPSPRPRVDGLPLLEGHDGGSPGSGDVG